MKKNKILPAVLFVFSLALAVISLFVLPETVITQFSVGSSSPTTMPKLAAVAIPSILGAGASAASFFIKDDKKSSNKYCLVSGVGVVILIIMLIVNL